MPAYYTYLISSLPTLRFGQNAPFSYDKFLAQCSGVISDDDKSLLAILPTLPVYDYHGDEPVVKRMKSFEIALRNELVRIRASRRHVDPGVYMRKAEEAEIAINHIAINAYRAASVLESERMLDEARWHTLDEISAGHYFDKDVLIVYAFKLLMLEKWDSINKLNNVNTLDAVLAKVS